MPPCPSSSAATRRIFQTDVKIFEADAGRLNPRRAAPLSLTLKAATRTSPSCPCNPPCAGLSGRATARTAEPFQLTSASPPGRSAGDVLIPRALHLRVTGLRVRPPDGLVRRKEARHRIGAGRIIYRAPRATAGAGRCHCRRSVCRRFGKGVSYGGE